MFAPTEHKARRLPAKPPPPELIALGHQPVARRPSPSTVACPGRSALGVQLCSGDPLQRVSADPVRAALQRRGLHRAQPASAASQPSANTCSTYGCCVVVGAASVEPAEPLDAIRRLGLRGAHGGHGGHGLDGAGHGGHGLSVASDGAARVEPAEPAEPLDAQIRLLGLGAAGAALLDPPPQSMPPPRPKPRAAALAPKTLAPTPGATGPQPLSRPSAVSGGAAPTARP